MFSQVDIIAKEEGPSRVSPVLFSACGNYKALALLLDSRLWDVFKWQLKG